jgi:outer membrane protein OmpA-like peptidoglycan-associated protein/tetratricopeptide (TPR) repeat protein
MKKKIQLLFILSLFIGTVMSQPVTKPEQSFKSLFAKSTSYLYEENYPLALETLLKLDSIQPGIPNIKYLIGFCYTKPPIDAKKAINYLEKASANMSKNYRDGYYKEDKSPVESLRYLADAYLLNNEFEIAIATYERYKTEINPKETELIKDIERQINMCRVGSDRIKSPVNMIVTNVGGAINSPYPDYAAVVNADESVMIYTTRRPTSTGGQMQDGKYFEDIFISEKINGIWSQATNIGGPINTNDHEATVGLSVDGQTLLIYKYENEIGFGDLFSSKQIGNRWTVPQPLGSNINTEFWESHASMSADGQLLFFTSNRPGGVGGRDIYFCRKLPTGEWGLAQNIGKNINTAFDEDGPYIHPDGTTLFFSSKGHSTMGGFDIFFSEYDNETRTWGRPQNMGYPVNTTSDDVFFVPTADGKRAYYSSYRKDGFGDQDIYMITFPEVKEIPLTVFKGVVKSATGGVPQDIFITVTDNESGEIVGNYSPNMETGKYLFILKPGKNYNITYESEGYLFKSENIEVPENSAYQEINKAIDIEPIIVGSTITLNNIFFDYNSSELKQESFVELEKLYKLIKNNPSLKIEIGGHTDSKGSMDANMRLSQERTQSVVNYLITQGIDEKKLVAKGYGPTKPIAPNTNEDGSDNPEGRAKNRRIEMKILEVSGK